MYNIVPKCNITLYVREAEFRINIRNLSYDEKIKNIADIFKYVNSCNNNECYGDEILNAL